MSVPVLMYHHVLPKSAFLSSSLEEFRSQMEFLYKNNYKTLTSEEFYLYKQKKLKLPKKSVFLTFDDGWRDNFIYAYPILKEFSLHATIFLVSQWINEASKKDEAYIEAYHEEAKKLAQSQARAVLMNWEEVKEMKASGLIDFHSHTYSHSDGYFDNFSFEDELKLSKQDIEKNLNFTERQLCWPRGKYNENMLKLAKKAGYEIFYTTKRGINKADNSLDEIKRIAVKKGASWLKKTLFIYQNDFLGALYSKIKKG